MSTLVASTPQAPATPETNVTSERNDYVVGHDLKTPKGEVLAAPEPAYYGASSEDELQVLKKKIEEGFFKPNFQVTVSVPRAKNFAGIKEICPDEDEAAGNFNRGARQKANNRLKAKLLELDDDGNLKFDPAGKNEDGTPVLTNGVLDMTSEIASPSKRKVLSEEEKLDRFLEQFPESTRNMMKQAYLASRQAPVAA